MGHSRASRKTRRIILAALLIVTFAALSATLFYLDRINADICRTLTNRAVKQVENTYKLFTKPVVESLRTAQALGKADKLDLERTEALSTFLLSTLNQTPILLAGMIADTTGREYRLSRKEQIWVIRDCSANRPAASRFQFREVDESGRVLSTWPTASDYDPRRRPWFEGALAGAESGKVFWTRLYPFHTGGRLGVTAAIAWSAGNASDTHVVAAFDILLNQLLRFESDLQITPGTRVFLTGEGGTVFHLTQLIQKEWSEDVEAETTRPAPAVETAISAWEHGDHEPETPVVFQADGIRWWAGFRELSIGNQAYHIGVAVPQNELLPEGRRRYRLLAVLLGGIMVVGILAALLITEFTARKERVSRFPLDGRLPTEAQIRDLIQGGESEALEFKSTLRWNMRAGRHGKEIELAWLKTVVAFLNSSGGTLLIGVQDDGTVLGLAFDGFQNADKCLLHVNNLIQEHIGSSHAQHIRFHIRSVSGEPILVIACEPATAPAFLNHQKSEDFYIRSGPASIRLTMREMLEYLDRKKS